MSTGYRKRPTAVYAIQWSGDNDADVIAFTGPAIFTALDPDDATADPGHTAQVFDTLHSTWVGVHTGDWIIRGIAGEHYPCRDTVFTQTYLPAADFEAAVAEAIRDFDFADHGMDEFDVILDEEWVENLARLITHHLTATP